MPDDLKQRATSAIAWSFVERAGQQGVQFAISIILARVLLPEEFGVLAMLAIFISLGQVCVDSGFGQALIQKKDATHLDECSIFYSNVALGIAAYTILWAAAPWIASFYEMPTLTSLCRVLSLNLIIISLGLIQTTLLTKQVDFKAQAAISLTAVLTSGAIGLTMAYNGFGAWSLVSQSLALNSTQTTLLWLCHRWRPSRTFSFNSLRELFPFGSKLLACGLLDTFFNNLYLVLIGRLYSPAELGFYHRARQTQQFPVGNIATIVGRVTYPLFSSVHDDKNRLKRGVRKALSAASLLTFPAMTLLAVMAEPLVNVLLTSKWGPCVPYLQLLCLAGVLLPLHVINLNALIAQGRSDLFLKLDVTKRALTLAVVAATCGWGIVALLYGQIVISILSYFLNTLYSGKLFDYPMSEQVKDASPLIAISLAAGAAAYSLRLVSLPNEMSLLAAQLITAVAVYVPLCHFFRVPIYIEAEQLALRHLKGLRSH